MKKINRRLLSGASLPALALGVFAVGIAVPVEEANAACTTVTGTAFDPSKVARYTPARIQKLTLNAAIIRNRMKIEAAVKNARALLAVQNEFGTFDAYAWRFVDGRPIVNRWKSSRRIPATSPESDAFSKDLKRRGFTFVGSTVIYAHMQAIGMVNDHLIDCFRYRQV